MGFDELLPDAVRVDHVPECGRVAVGERIVTDHPFDRDPEGCVERDRAFENPGRCRAFLVVMDLRVGETGVVVDDGVDVVVAKAALAFRAFATAVQTPPAAIRDAAEFLHIDVDQ